MRIFACSWKDIANPFAGGAEIYLHEVAKRWVEWGHDVTVFAGLHNGLATQDEIDGVQIRRGGHRYTFVYRRARHFYETEGNGRFDVVLDVVNTRPFLCPRYVRDIPVVALIHQVAREIWFH